MSDDKDIGWMYQGAKALVNREDYLLGKKIDKSFEKYSDAVNEEKPEALDALLHTRTVVRPQPSVVKTSALESYVVATEDPLVAVKVKEETRRREVLENPLMKLKFQKMLKEMMAEREGKAEKKKKKKKKRKDSEHERKPSKLKKERRKSKEITSISEKSKITRHQEVKSFSKFHSDSDDDRRSKDRGKKYSSTRKVKEQSNSPVTPKHRQGNRRHSVSHESTSKKRRRSEPSSERGRRRSLSSSDEKHRRERHKESRFKNEKRESCDRSRSRSLSREHNVPRSGDRSCEGRQSTSPVRQRSQQASKERRSGSRSESRSRLPPSKHEKSLDDSQSPRRNNRNRASPSRRDESSRNDRKLKEQRSSNRSTSPRRRRHSSQLENKTRRRKRASSSSSSSTSSSKDSSEEKRVAVSSNKRKGRTSSWSSAHSPPPLIKKQESIAFDHSNLPSSSKDEEKKPRTFDSHIPEHLRPKGLGSSSEEEEVEDRFDREERERKKRFEGFGLVGVKKKVDNDDAAPASENPYELSRKPTLPVYKKPERRRSLTEEEKQEKLKEMAQNAVWRQEIRKSNLKKARLVEEKEADEDAKDKAPSFIRSQLNSAASDLTVEQRLQSNKRSLQRSHGFMEPKFTSK